MVGSYLCQYGHGWLVGMSAVQKVDVLVKKKQIEIDCLIYLLSLWYLKKFYHLTAGVECSGSPFWSV